ncbi:MAG: hypothetical protein OXI46_01735 [Gemmatimonadota bacterium]|nr:hypothetical protein [Gemmatimonadota bacterium]
MYFDDRDIDDPVALREGAPRGPDVQHREPDFGERGSLQSRVGGPAPDVGVVDPEPAVSPEQCEDRS